MGANLDGPRAAGIPPRLDGFRAGHRERTNNEVMQGVHRSQWAALLSQHPAIAAVRLVEPIPLSPFGACCSGVPLAQRWGKPPMTTPRHVWRLGSGLGYWSTAMPPA